ncbi:PLP-dependent aminotransferase family protein [Paenibacillus caui]|uniref:aminotransferase-like domain-containing protein n=1 Tax=Paenibacillus caui TaxID=2873927 RepID=UPI001CA86A6E|nr:PLP-dependent aminotransferase family protein [Paenibacillus caui]
MNWSKAAQNLKPSVVRMILKESQGEGMLSLAGGLPSPAMFPVQDVRDAYERALNGERNVLQYGLTEGYAPLRDKIRQRMESKNVHCETEDILLTTGSQQSIDLFCRIFLDPGDPVLVESPTYLAALQVLGTYRAQIHGVASDEEGMLPDDLEAKLRTIKPKFVYVGPTFSNPTGRVWSISRREGLVRLCRQYGTLILEDDPYGELSFEPTDRPPLLCELDESYGGKRHVVYTSTFSKIVAPALRTGWITGDRDIISMLARAKQAADLHSSSIDQRALDALMEEFDLNGHIRSVSDEYHRRLTRLEESLAAKWKETSWHTPRGGMFIWVRLPETVDTGQLLPFAIKEKVTFVPGEHFYEGRPHKNTMRLNFTHTEPQLIGEAVDRLCRAYRAFSEQKEAARENVK